MTGKKVERFRDYYWEAIEIVYSRLLTISNPSNFHYFKQGANFEFDQNSCIAGGLFSLASLNNNNSTQSERDRKEGLELVNTCNALFERSPTKLAPFSVTFINDFGDYFKDNYFYYLRSETLESLFYLFKITGDESYRSLLFKIFNTYSLISDFQRQSICNFRGHRFYV